MQVIVVFTSITEVPGKIGPSSVIGTLFYLTTATGHFPSARSTYTPSMRSAQRVHQMCRVSATDRKSFAALS